MIKKNWHTHHKLCNHAEGMAEDYVQEALNIGLDTLGFSDHAPSDAISDTHVRMHWDALPLYIEDIKRAQKAHESRIAIHIGLEAEYFDTNPAYYERLLANVEYLILGQHYVHMRNPRNSLLSAFELKKPAALIVYAKSIENALKTGYFSLVAHPDLYMCGYERFDETAKKAANIICEASLRHDIPLELNANGIRRGLIQTVEGERYPYPSLPFWQIAKSKGCKIVLSSDCHHPTLMYDTAMKVAEALIENLGLKITDVIRFPK